MIEKVKKVSKYFFPTLYFLLVKSVFAAPTTVPTNQIQVNSTDIGFKIPTLGDILTFAIRGFFIVAGLLALIFLLTGALSWVTSGGNKENVDKARDKITNAILGLIMIVGVLALVVTLEQMVFGGNLCLGISCAIKIPPLLQPPS